MSNFISNMLLALVIDQCPVPHKPALSYEEQLVTCQHLAECLKRPTRLVPYDERVDGSRLYRCAIKGTTKSMYGEQLSNAVHMCEWIKDLE
jgi:hypothetical protein